MDYTGAGAPGPMQLLHGCCTEAERSARAALGLDGLRDAIDQKYRAHMTSVSDEIRSTSRLLWELADRSQVHMSRVPEVLNYLNVLLPCLSRTLRDITGFYDDKTLSREVRWRKMYHDMSGEGKLPLPHRFMLYNHFLTLLGQLLTRSAQFDLNALDTLQEKILKLREDMGIPRPPAHVGLVVTQALLHKSSRERSDHWALDIFSRPLPSRTPLKVKRHRPSETRGPYFHLGEVTKIPPDSRILFRRLFDNGSISVSVYLNPSRAPFVLVRQQYYGQSRYSMKGVHQLLVDQSDDALVLNRWSDTIRDGKPWAVLSFITWEEMVLFHCTFVALKSQSLLSEKIGHTEYHLNSEKRLFQARIIDDQLDHTLIVYRDTATNGIRLHAAVWEGEIRKSPVWTAFVTHQCKSATWLELQKDKHHVFLKDVQLYVFSPQYRQERMRRNKYGAFEIYFYTVEAAAKFKDVFYPPPRVSPSVMRPTEITEAAEAPASGP